MDGPFLAFLKRFSHQHQELLEGFNDLMRDGKGIGFNIINYYEDLSPFGDLKPVSMIIIEAKTCTLKHLSIPPLIAMIRCFPSILQPLAMRMKTVSECTNAMSTLEMPF